MKKTDILGAYQRINKYRNAWYSDNKSFIKWQETYFGNLQWNEYTDKKADEIIHTPYS